MIIGTKENITEKGKAGYPAIYLVSPEDVRSLKAIQEAAADLKRELYVWTLGRGLEEVTDKPRPKVIEDTENPSGLAVFLASKELKPKTVVVLRHFHHFMEDPGVQSALIQAIPEFKQKGQMLIVLTPVLKLPPELEKEFALIESALPSKQDLEKVLDGVITGSKLPQELIPSPELRKHLVEASMGLTTQEAENAFSLSLIRPKLLTGQARWDASVVLEEKCQALKKTGLLQYYPPTGLGMDAVGGMGALKQWFNIRRGAFTEDARRWGLDVPKGVLLVGIPGSGKSLSAKAVAETLNLPLIRCDVGRIYGGLVGQSEANVRTVIQTAEAVSPCILWFDEIEKAFAGAGGSGNLDSGVGARVFGTFLTWMQEKTAPVFVFATANNVRSLPPEFLRKGRFDEIFSVLLPNHEERKEIFRIHLSKRGRAGRIGANLERNLIGPIDLDHFAKETDGWSGAEIEAAVVEAMFTAFASGRENADVGFMDLQEAIDRTVPLSETMKDEIQAMTNWCERRTRSASDVAPATHAVVPTVGNRRLDA